MMRSKMLRTWVVFGAFIGAAGCVASFNPVLSEAGDAPAQDERADTPAAETNDGTTTPDAGDGAAIIDLPDTPAVDDAPDAGDASDVRDASDEFAEVALPDIPSPMDVPSDVRDVMTVVDIVDVNDVPVVPDIPAPQDVRDVPVEDQGSVCPMATIRCAGACVDTQTNPSHCGGCGVVCSLPRATAACVGGRCRVGACNANAGDCDTNPDNGCEVDLLGDSAHCGRCGGACGTGRFCSNGACVTCGSAGAPACPPGGTCSGLTNCGGTCRDTATDTNHCGACNRGCVAPSGGSVMCAGGSCVQSCPSGQTVCGTNCVDLSSDAANCGGCSRACRTDQTCAGGVCDCPSGRTRCGTACVDTQTDAANCGGCGRPCRARGACVASVCNEQRSCQTPGTPGCGMVDVTGNVPFTLGGDSLAIRANPGQTNIRVGNFTLDAYEVTVARFRVFWAARMVDGGASIRARPIRYPDGTTISWGTNTGREPTLNDPSYCNWSSVPGVPSREAHPINCVNWWTAQEFCVWDGGAGTYGTASNGRLPTEAEWEYAARYRSASGLTAGREFPWGNTSPSATCDRARWNRLGCSGDDGGATRRVGSFPLGASGGLFDLAGNVGEWTADWSSSYSPTSTDAGLSCWGGVGRLNPICEDGAISHRVIRGGSWGDNVVDVLRSAGRGDAVLPIGSGPGLGFRCFGTVTE